MGLDLQAATTAIITMECQRGVIGDLATIPSVARAVDASGALHRMAAVVNAGRTAGATIAHARVEFRHDLAGSPTNAPLLRFTATLPDQLRVGSPSVEVVPELVASSDLHSVRGHGVSPFTGTDLDALLRSRRIDTIVAVGVSLNVGVLGLCFEAVNLGYVVVLPADAVPAIPESASAPLLANTYGQLVTISTTDEVVAAFGG